MPWGVDREPIQLACEGPEVEQPSDVVDRRRAQHAHAVQGQQLRGRGGHAPILPAPTDTPDNL